MRGVQLLLSGYAYVYRQTDTQITKPPGTLCHGGVKANQGCVEAQLSVGVKGLGLQCLGWAPQPVGAPPALPFPQGVSR